MKKVCYRYDSNLVIIVYCFRQNNQNGELQFYTDYRQRR